MIKSEFEEVYTSISEALREAIDSEDFTSYSAIERDTGVLRQSIMNFHYNKTGLSMENADKLLRYFGFKLVR